MFNYIKALIASLVLYDNTTSGLTATNVQDAIDEIATAGVDPFAVALFDDCTPLFDKDEVCNVELLNECG